jgi:hypothetical protein
MEAPDTGNSVSLSVVGSEERTTFYMGMGFGFRGSGSKVLLAQSPLRPQPAFPTWSTIRTLQVVFRLGPGGVP